jgi:hypothetical protein
MLRDHAHPVPQELSHASVDFREEDLRHAEQADGEGGGFSPPQHARATCREIRPN